MAKNQYIDLSPAIDPVFWDLDDPNSDINQLLNLLADAVYGDIIEQVDNVGNDWYPLKAVDMGFYDSWLGVSNRSTLFTGSGYPAETLAAYEKAGTDTVTVYGATNDVILLDNNSTKHVFVVVDDGGGNSHYEIQDYTGQAGVVLDPVYFVDPLGVYWQFVLLADGTLYWNSVEGIPGSGTFFTQNSPLYVQASTGNVFRLSMIDLNGTPQIRSTTMTNILPGSTTTSMYVFSGTQNMLYLSVDDQVQINIQFLNSTMTADDVAVAINKSAYAVWGSNYGAYDGTSGIASVDSSITGGALKLTAPNIKPHIGAMSVIVVNTGTNDASGVLFNVPEYPWIIYGTGINEFEWYRMKVMSCLLAVYNAPTMDSLNYCAGAATQQPCFVDTIADNPNWYWIIGTSALIPYARPAGGWNSSNVPVPFVDSIYFNKMAWLQGRASMPGIVLYMFTDPNQPADIMSYEIAELEGLMKQLYIPSLIQFIVIPKRQPSNTILWSGAFGDTTLPNGYNSFKTSTFYNMSQGEDAYGNLKDYWIPTSVDSSTNTVGFDSTSVAIGAGTWQFNTYEVILSTRLVRSFWYWIDSVGQWIPLNPLDKITIISNTNIKFRMRLTDLKNLELYRFVSMMVREIGAAYV